MTVTALLTAQAVGTGANKGTGLYASHTTLQAATSGLQVQCKWTLGAAAAIAGSHIRVWVAVSAFSDSASIPQKYECTAQVFEIPVPRDPSSSRVGQTDFILNVGGECYVWFEVPTTDVAGTLDANLVEI